MIRIKPDEPRPAVTEKLRDTVTKPVTKSSGVTIARKGGRPKVHKTDADRQRAYRQRKASTAAEPTQPDGDFLI